MTYGKIREEDFRISVVHGDGGARNRNPCSCPKES